MLVETHLNAKEYKLFKAKADQLNISEYELAKQGILTIINQPVETVRVRILLTKLMVAVAKDLNETKTNLI
jgi:hypothetical protein